MPRFEIAVANGISGFSLEVDLLDLTQNPFTVVLFLPTAPDSSAAAGMIAPDSSAAVPDREFYQIGAMGRDLPCWHAVVGLTLFRSKTVCDCIYWAHFICRIKLQLSPTLK